MKGFFIFSGHDHSARWSFIHLMAWLAMAGFAMAAPKELSFGTPVGLKEEGLKFKVPNGAKAQILPPPTVYHATDGNGQSSERYAPRELWYASQYCGRWINPAGQALTLAVVRQSLPKDFAEPYVAREVYDTALAQAPDPVSHTEALPTWLSNFSGAPIKGKPRTLPDSIRLENVLAVEFEGRDPARMGYLFSLKSNILGAAPARRFFALFEWKDDLPATDAMRAIEHNFLPSVEAFGGPLPEPVAASTSMQNKSVAGKVEQSAEFLQSREKAINSIKGLKGWWFVETANYVLVADLPMSQKQFIRQLQSDLEYLHAAYMQILPPRVAIEAVSVVRIFNKAEAYNQYVGPAHSWSEGLWLPNKTELVIKSMDWGDANRRQQAMAGIVYHEAFHQYLFYAFDKINVPVWYNEGHATFFEGAQITKKGFDVGEMEGYRQVIETLIAKKKVDLRSLLVMNDDDFYTHGGEQGRREHYALAWGLIYYLRKGAPLEKNQAYARLLDNYADSLFQTRNPEEAIRTMLESLDMTQFTAAFTDFWKSEPRRMVARRNAIFKNIATSLPQE